MRIEKATNGDEVKQKSDECDEKKTEKRRSATKRRWRATKCDEETEERRGQTRGNEVLPKPAKQPKHIF